METPSRTNIYSHPHTLLKSVFIETKQVFRSKLVTEWIYSYTELDFPLLVLLQDLSFLTSVPAVCIFLCLFDQYKMSESNLVFSLFFCSEMPPALTVATASYREIWFWYRQISHRQLRNFQTYLVFGLSSSGSAIGYLSYGSSCSLFVYRRS